MNGYNITITPEEKHTKKPALQSLSPEHGREPVGGRLVKQLTHAATKSNPL